MATYNGLPESVSHGNCQGLAWPTETLDMSGDFESLLAILNDVTQLTNQ